MSTINLLPKDYLQSRTRRRSTILCLLLFALVMGGVAAATFVSQRSGRYTLKVRNRVNASYARAAELIAQMQELQAKKLAMCRKAETTACLIERVPRSTLLGIVTNALPKGASLTKFSLNTKIVRPAETDASRAAKKKRKLPKKSTKFGAAKDAGPQAPPTVVEMEVTGLAHNDLQVARFMAELIRNPLLTSVDLVVSQEKVVDKVPVREFEVKLKLRPGVDALDALAPPEPAVEPKPAPPAASKDLARAETAGEQP